MSSIAGHSADYDRELCHDLTAEDLSRRREQLNQLRHQSDVQLRNQLGTLAERARALLSAGKFHALRSLLLEIAQLSNGSSASLLYGCCVALAEDIASAGYRPWHSLLLAKRPQLKELHAPVNLMLAECSRLLQNRVEPARELVEYVERFWQDSSSSQPEERDA